MLRDRNGKYNIVPMSFTNHYVNGTVVRSCMEFCAGTRPFPISTGGGTILSVASADLVSFGNGNVRRCFLNFGIQAEHAKNIVRYAVMHIRKRLYLLFYGPSLSGRSPCDELLLTVQTTSFSIVQLSCTVFDVFQYFGRKQVLCFFHS